MCIYMYIYTHIHMCVCVFVYYIYIYIVKHAQHRAAASGSFNSPKFGSTMNAGFS